MTTAVFNLMFDKLIGAEGGFQNDPNDRGNWTSGIIGKGECKGTKYGVSAMAYPDLDIENLTIEQAKKIFYNDYWCKVKADNLPDALSIMVSDTAYNSGCSAERPGDKVKLKESHQPPVKSADYNEYKTYFIKHFITPFLLFCTD